MKFLRSKIAACNLDPKNFGTQSLRIGGATSLAALGYPDSTIKAIGRWNSACYQLYIRLLPHDLQNISQRFASSAIEPSPKADFFRGLSLDAALTLRRDNLARFFGAHT
jgi:hypothetical protein